MHKGSVSGSVEQNKVNPVFDLLSGEFLFEQPAVQSEMPNEAQNWTPPSGVALDFIDEYVNKDSSDELSKGTVGVEHYLNCARGLTDKVCKIRQ